MALYKGFSSFEFQKNGTFLLTDTELVKLDLLNHIFTRRGERVMMPNFGTSIPDLVFEPITEDLLEQIQDEITTVIEYDPRVSLLDFKIVPYHDENRVIANFTIRYIELNMTETIDLHLEFRG